MELCDLANYADDSTPFIITSTVEVGFVALKRYLKCHDMDMIFHASNSI